MRPQRAVDFLRAAQRQMQDAVVGRHFHPHVNIVAEQLSAFRALRFRQQGGSQVGVPDAADFIEQQLLAGVQTVGRDLEGEGEHERRQSERRAHDRTDGGVMQFARAFHGAATQPLPDLNRDQDK